MKLCKLKLKNLNSFRKEEEIDFENPPLDGASLVAITGRTGSGKTTLLDAICVALYGKTPRLSGTGSQHSRHLISHGEKEGFAEVHFVANGTRYIASRTLRRGGSAEVRLSYAEDNRLISDKLSGKGKALGPSQRTVSEEVESILGLDFDTFKRSVMLAQGEFAAFLKADLKDRREILEKTAGIGIYKKLNDKLNEKESEVREAYNRLNLQRDVLLPVASPEQLVLAQEDLVKLEERAKVLVEENQNVQKKKELETKRREDFDELESSKEKQKKLLAQQPEIDVLQVEKENAVRAQSIFPERQAFDNARSDLEMARNALNAAIVEKTDAEQCVEDDRADYSLKEAAYQAASTEHDRRMDVYNAAKLDVGRAADQFAEADKRALGLGNLSNQIGTLETQLTDSETERSRLQERIDEAKTFLDENPLPSDRQQRLNRATGLLAQLESEEKQLDDKVESREEYAEKVLSLKGKLDALSNDYQMHLREIADAESTLKSAKAELNSLLSVGTQDEWNDRKHQAVEAKPIAEKYELAIDELSDSEDRLQELNAEKVNLNEELEVIGNDLTHQMEVYQRTAKAVQHCDEVRESILLKGSANRLRQHLQSGEPCPVCGSTEHPHTDIVESEDVESLNEAKEALADARADALTAQEHLQILKTKQIQTEQSKCNTVSQIDECYDGINALQEHTAQLLAEWQKIYPDNEVSSEWATEKIEGADTAITNLRKAETIHTDVSHAYQMVSQQFKASKGEIERETKSLNGVEKQLQDVINDIKDFEEEIASIKERFWDLLPEAFHEFAPLESKDQFSEKIEEVAKRKDKLDSAETDLKLLNAKIDTDRSNLDNLGKDHKELQAEIDGYRRDAESYLTDVRERTGGLETEDEIGDAIDKLEAELQSKKTERDAADQQLQKRKTFLTQKQTTYKHCEDHHTACRQKLETARNAYFDKLDGAGFDSPGVHDKAFRDDTQMQALTDRIDAHEHEKQVLTLRITELRIRFEVNPFDWEALDRIKIEAEESERQHQEAQQKVGEQQKTIKDLEKALKEREALEHKVQHAAEEVQRWERLKDIIGENKLFNFASTIILEQVNRLANGQLESLSSGRYQLKAEGVDDKLRLAVLDQWNANEERPVETLSGGESFLTSLALALALSDMSRGRAQLNSLFLDEGFGTLDAETLDTAISALEGLHMHGRSIFLISHVQELTRRLPVKINVRKHGNDNLDSSYSSSILIRG